MAQSAAPWSDEAYGALEAALRNRGGLVFQPLRRSAVEAAATRVMRRLGVSSPEAFVPLVEQRGAIFDDLMAEVTIGETYFFREPQQFGVLRQLILPEFRLRADIGQTFRAWSAGCSTGEEAYSIAITLRENGVPGLVVGTDVSRVRLGVARRGEYRRWSFRGVPEHIVNQYFTRDRDAYVLAPDIRRDVDFRYLNLAADTYPVMSSGVWGMDLILCRNVLIYMDRRTMARIATGLLDTLAEDGWLLLGATDPPLHEFIRCEVVQTEAGLAYRRFRGRPRRAARSPMAAGRPKPSVALEFPATAPAPPIPPISVESPPPAPVPTARLEPPTPASSSPRAEQPRTGDDAARAYQQHEYETVVSLLAPAASAGTADVAQFVLYIRALANLGRLEEAGRACAAALDRHRSHPELYYLHAVLVGQSERFVESARAARQALYLDRSMIVAHLALGSALASAGEPDGASRAFAAAERLLSAMPPDAPVPAADGEPAGRLLEMTRLQAKLVRRGRAS